MPNMMKAEIIRNRYTAACQVNQPINPDRIRTVLMPMLDNVREIRIAQSYSELRFRDSIPYHQRLETNLNVSGMDSIWQHSRLRPVHSFHFSLPNGTRMNVVDLSYLSMFESGLITLYDHVPVGTPQNLIPDNPSVPSSLTYHNFEILEAVEAGAWKMCFNFGTRELWIVPIPETIRVDNRNRLHCENGPAVVSLTSQLFSWHGITVDSSIILSPETIKLETIYAEPNVEMRRILTERYGLDRFMIDSHADVISSETINGQVYELYLREQLFDENIVMVRVVNSTPEPDGTFKNYWLRVPPTTTSALAAVAWTFRMLPHRYVSLAVES